MDRTTGANWVDLGGGRRGFKDENVAGGVTGTEVQAAHLNAIQEEILTVIEQTGQVPDANDWTQLYRGAELLIDKKLTKLGNRIYPEVNGSLPQNHSDHGHITFVAGVGKLTIGTDNKIAYLVTQEADTQFLPLGERELFFNANSTYHLRWVAPGIVFAGFSVDENLFPNGKFLALDLTDPAYNPASLLEDNGFFNSNSVSMLFGRVDTDAQNNLTVTRLLNLPQLYLGANRPSVTQHPSSPPVNTYLLNWSRSPVLFFRHFSCSVPGSESQVIEIITNRTRYSVDINVTGFSQVLPAGSQVLSGSYFVDMWDERL